MSGPILNQPWEDVADDVTGAIEKAVQPLIKKATDDIYAGLLESTQDYLRDNLAFNIASRIDAAERDAADSRKKLTDLQAAIIQIASDFAPSNRDETALALSEMRQALWNLIQGPSA